MKSLNLTNLVLFYIVEDNMQAKKVNRRNEDKVTAKDVLPPRRLQIISSS